MYKHILLAIPVVSSILISACSRPDESSQNIPRAAEIISIPQENKSSQADAEAPVTSKELLNKYRADLVLAKKVWDDCRAIGLEKVSSDKKPECVAAGNAWHNQPYKSNR